MQFSDLLCSIFTNIGSQYMRAVRFLNINYFQTNAESQSSHNNT